MIPTYYYYCYVFVCEYLAARSLGMISSIPERLWDRVNLNEIRSGNARHYLTMSCTRNGESRPLTSVMHKAQPEQKVSGALLGKTVMQ